MKYISILLLITLFFTSCKDQNPDVTLICYLNKNATYIIRWDFDSNIEGTVDIYTSTDPETFKNSKYIGKYDIKKGYAEVNSKTLTQKNFFLLNFNDKYQYKLGTHFTNFENIQNFRDIGGYQSSDNKRLKWSKIYRSGTLIYASEYDVDKLCGINVKTLINIQTYPDLDEYPLYKFPFIKSYKDLSLKSGVIHPADLMLSDIYKVGDANLYLQDMLIGISEMSKSEIRRIFDILLDESSYPVLFTDKYGMHQMNFIIPIIMYAIDIPHELVLKDAMLSNKYFNKRSLNEIVRRYSENTQCIFTTILTVKERYIESLNYYINKKYCSFDDYFEKEIGLTRKERDKLKSILLE